MFTVRPRKKCAKDVAAVSAGKKRRRRSFVEKKYLHYILVGAYSEKRPVF